MGKKKNRTKAPGVDGARFEGHKKTGRAKKHSFGRSPGMTRAMNKKRKKRR